MVSTILKVPPFLHSWADNCDVLGSAQSYTETSHYAFIICIISGGNLTNSQKRTVDISFTIIIFINCPMQLSISKRPGGGQWGDGLVICFHAQIQMSCVFFGKRRTRGGPHFKLRSKVFAYVGTLGGSVEMGGLVVVTPSNNAIPRGRSVRLSEQRPLPGRHFQVNVRKTNM